MTFSKTTSECAIDLRGLPKTLEKADPNIPFLAQVRAEYDRLKLGRCRLKEFEVTFLPLSTTLSRRNQDLHPQVSQCLQMCRITWPDYGSLARDQPRQTHSESVAAGHEKTRNTGCIIFAQPK